MPKSLNRIAVSDGGWVLDMTPEMARAASVAEGSLVVLYFKNSGARSLPEKSFSVFSVPPWCIFFLAISTRRHGVQTTRRNSIFPTDCYVTSFAPKCERLPMNLRTHSRR